MKTKNKVLIFIFILSLSGNFLKSKEDQTKKETPEKEPTEVTFDNLQTPDSPGFILLGISPTDINRPGTPTDLAFSILSSTNYFSTIPKNFSLEFSPYWVFAGKNLTFDKYSKENPFNNFIHTFSVSLATNTISENDIDNTSLSIGGRASLLKGKYRIVVQALKIYESLLELHKNELAKKIVKIEASNFTENEKKSKITEAYNQYNRIINYIKIHDDNSKKEVLELYEKQYNDEKNSNEKDAKEKYEKIKKIWEEEYNEIKKQYENDQRFRFTGLKWDVAGGIVINFPRSDFDQGKIGKWGVWTSGGYELKLWSFLGVARVLKNVREGTKASIDGGIRIIYDSNKKVVVSSEGLIRFNSEEIENKKTQWRYVANLEYNFGKNQKMTFSLGRDFKGNKTGNLIAMINFLFGIGSNRPKNNWSTVGK